MSTRLGNNRARESTLTPTIAGDRITVYWEKDKGGEARKMANNTQPGQSPEEQRQAWLTEYEVCQKHNDTIGSQVWVSTTIFLTVNVTLLGGLFYTTITRILFENPDLGSISLPIRIALIFLTTLSIGMILILGKWVDWLKRMRFRTSVNYERMYVIEPFLGMRRHTMCRELDDEYKSLNKSDSAKAKIKEFEKRNENLKYFKASGFNGLIHISSVIRVIWGVASLGLLIVLIASLVTRA